jgi:leader peptidase (prepilin peptidase) / N-methyltransferase
VTLLVAILALAGAAWGLAADRIAVRWPEHGPGEGGRRPGWRTAVTVAAAATAFAVLAARDPEPATFVILAAWFVVLVPLFAIDLDQRLLPNELTLPLVVVAAVLLVAGLNPLVKGAELGAVAAATVIPAVLFVISIPFGRGAFGLGDVKYLVSAGLLTGFSRTLSGVVVGIILAGVVLLVLVALRRITLRTYVPYGPFLIVGAVYAVLVSL